MWQKPWKLREGIAIGCGLLVIGAILQFITGGILWQLFAFPANALALLIYLLLIGVAYWMREKVYFIRYLMSTKSAATSMLFVVGLTFIMGLTRQVPSGNKAVDPIGLTNMLSFWPFVLIYLWMTTTVGLATLQRLVHFKKTTFCQRYITLRTLYCCRLWNLRLCRYPKVKDVLSSRRSRMACNGRAWTS